MPKRGGFGGGGSGRGRWIDPDTREHNYNEHDDRRSKDNRRVSFKPNSHRAKNRQFNSLKKFEDEDIDMKDHAIVTVSRGSNKNFRGNFRGRGGRKDGRVNSPAPRQSFPVRKLMPGVSPWYQVTLPYGNKHDKNYVLNVLKTAINTEVFIPHCYSTVGNTAVFYVDDFNLAEKLQGADRKITMPDGFKLAVKVKSGSPHVTIDSTLLEKMKLAMAGRYNAATKALDLTKFHADPALIDYFCALFRPSTMVAVIDIIAENIPDLEAINLNDNKINIVDNIKTLLKRLPNLKILYLANNRIQHINSLELLKGFSITEIYLEGNPLADRFKEKEIYIREVQKKFPKLVKLDGVVLPPVIGFDVSEDVNLPVSKPSFFCNVEGQTIVKQFLEQYFALYDSDSRQPLLNAYHENAIFSLSSVNNHQNNYNKLNDYLMYSRNLLRSQNMDGGKRNIRSGRLQIVSFLNDLPKTQHDPLSFTVDLTIFTPTFLMLTINGVFKETQSVAASGSNKSSTPPMRSFHKTLVIVPYNGGFCISNDMLYISNATPQQEKESFKAPVSMAQPPIQTTIAAPVPVPPSIQANPDVRQQMLQHLGTFSNMNLEWCTNCLEQTQWNIEKAMIIFNQLHSQGKIPPEAFIK